MAARGRTTGGGARRTVLRVSGQDRRTRTSRGPAAPPTGKRLNEVYLAKFPMTRTRHSGTSSDGHKPTIIATHRGAQARGNDRGHQGQAQKPQCTIIFCYRARKSFPSWGHDDVPHYVLPSSPPNSGACTGSANRDILRFCGLQRHCLRHSHSICDLILMRLASRVH
jgi:hypothetical protein